MQCPVDGATLLMSERSGVEIDYCPQCRGVWLDRGELDKLIERSDDDDRRDRDRPVERDRDERQLRAVSHDSRSKPYPKKRKSFLGEMFDFD